MTNTCPDLSIWFSNVFITYKILNRWIQAHCKFISGWVYYNVAWAIETLTINMTHIPFGRIASEIAMGSHLFLATLYLLRESHCRATLSLACLKRNCRPKPDAIMRWSNLRGPCLFGNEDVTPARRLIFRQRDARFCFAILSPDNQDRMHKPKC
jgi:hypothetical protein